MAPALQLRLDTLLLHLGSSALSACGAPTVGGGPQPQTPVPQPYQPRASGSDDALVQLRAAVAAAQAACGSGLCTPPRAPPSRLLVLMRSSSGDSAPPSPLPLSCCQPGAGEADGGASACSSGPASPRVGVRASANEGAASADAAPAIEPSLAKPLAAELSAKLLRALGSSAPAVARAAARAAAAAGGLAGAGGAPLDPESLPRLLPALAELRTGCWSARCGSLTGTSEAAAPLKPCAGGCGTACFCSRACATAAYAAHRAECQAAAASAPEAPTAGGGGRGRVRR